MLTKKSILLMSVAALGFLLCANAENAKAGPSVASALSMISKKLPQSAIKKICRKGNAGGGIFSIRSLNGILCSDPLVAAWTEEHCGSLSDEDSENYKASQCHTKALSALKGKSPEEALDATIAKGGPDAKAAQKIKDSE